MERVKQVIEMSGIYKYFPGIQAVKNVNLRIESGVVHAIVGENGAGKSTLMKILAGVHKKDKGEIIINGKNVSINTPADAKKLGITIIEQEFSLFSELNVFQNIFIGREISRYVKGLINWSKIKERTKAILKDLGLNININKPIKDLNTSEQQIIEIAKSLYFRDKLIIMDEPTSALGENEKEKLFKIIRDLKDQDVGIIYISHRMAEIFEIADIVTVMRDGISVGTYNISDVNENKIVKLMVGRELGNIFKREKNKAGKTVLEVRNLTKKRVFRDISFKVREGEVVGLSGLMGAGRTEIVKCIFGLDKFHSGEILLDGKKVNIRDPGKAIKMEIGFVPEDRRRDGIVPLMSVKNNIILPSLPNINKYGWIKGKKEKAIASKQVSALDIKIVSLEQRVLNLSGGNQQKVSLGKWLALSPRLLILDEPTRGIDVSAKSEVHKIIEKISKNGVAILMISSELPEILGVSDKIIVLHEGKITGQYNYKEATQERIMVNATSTL